MWSRILHPGKKKNEKDERERVVGSGPATPSRLVAPVVTNRPRSYTSGSASNDIPSTSPPQYVIETRSDSPLPILGSPIIDITSGSPTRARLRVSSPVARNSLSTTNTYKRSPPQPIQTYPFIAHNQSPQRSPPTTLEPPRISLPPPPRRRPSRTNFDREGKRGIRRAKSSQSMTMAHGHDGPRPLAWHAISGQVAAFHNARVAVNESGSMLERRSSSRENETWGRRSGSEEAGKDARSHATLTPSLSSRRKNPPKGWI